MHPNVLGVEGSGDLNEASLQTVGFGSEIITFLKDFWRADLNRNGPKIAN